MFWASSAISVAMAFKLMAKHSYIENIVTQRRGNWQWQRQGSQAVKDRDAKRLGTRTERPERLRLKDIL